MNELPLPEPLDDFLNRPPSLASDAATRESIFQKSARQLPPRRAERWPLLLSCAATFMLALLSAYYLYHRFPEPKNDIVEIKKAPDDAPKPPAPPPILVKAPPHPRDLEWSAFDAEDDPARVSLYFQAGDMYLERFDDMQSALRCYRQAIHYCDARDLEINPKDNWLVMALKRDQRKEK